jgi:membrane protein implicated in regulation of membrane protease activity
VVIGVVLLGLELLVPGGYLLWLGVAGIVTGLAAFFQPIDWPFQFMLFGALALIFIAAWLRYNRGREPESDRPYLNRRSERLIGQVLELREPIVEGIGRVSLDDTLWRVAGPDLPVGRRVRVIAVEAGLLRVEPA